MLKKILALALIIILGFSLGSLGFSQWDSRPIPLEKINWSSDAKWIEYPEETFRLYARKTFYLTEKTQVAWLRLSADNDFVLSVNGNTIANELSIINNSLGLSRRLSDKNQQLNLFPSYRALDAPEVFLKNNRDWKIAYYTDISAFLRMGKNVISVEVQNSQPHPRLALEGAITTNSGNKISLNTGGTSWRVYHLADKRQNIVWNQIDFPDFHWLDTPELASITENIYSRVRSNLFNLPLQGDWITANATEKGQLWFQKNWTVLDNSERAFLRFATNGIYHLNINNHLLDYKFNANENSLYMYDITNLLKKGDNNLVVNINTLLTNDKTNLDRKPLRIAVDGWTENGKGDIHNLIKTDETWNSFNNIKQGISQPTIIFKHPEHQTLRKRLQAAAYLLNFPRLLTHKLVWFLGGLFVSFLLAWSIGFYYLKLPEKSWDTIENGALILFPSNLFLFETALLRHRHGDGELAIFFSQSDSNSLLGLVWFILFLLTLFYGFSNYKNQKNSQYSNSRNILGLFIVGLIIPLTLTISQLFNLSLFVTIVLSVFLVILSFLPLLTTTHKNKIKLLINQFKSAWQKDYDKWLEIFLLTIVFFIGFLIRFHNLEFNALQGDENVSLDAAIGILKTGAPQSASDIWYTRSPAYHYMLALWLKILGNNAFNARLLSVVWGAMTLVVSYILAKNITKNKMLSFVIVLFLTIDPWEIQVSRFIRFYQVVQCLTMLSVWAFIKGFIDRDKRYYQYWFYVLITLAILNQEVTVTLLPCFFLGFVVLYRGIGFKKDISIFVGASMVVIITVYDILFFGIKCLTPWVALSYTTDAIIKPHLLNLSGFLTSSLVGFDRRHLIYSCLFFLGFIYSLYRKNAKMTWLYTTVLFNIIVTTLLVRQIAYRYLYSIYPLLIILAIYGGYIVWENVGEFIQSSLKNKLPFRQIAMFGLALLLMFNIQPWRVVGAYSNSIFMRNTEMFAYIKEHRQPGDVVISSSPFAAAVVLEGIDYFLPGTLSFDTLYWHEGRVIDRWAGGTIISNLDQLTRLQETATRIWLHLDDHKQSNFPEQLGEYAKNFGQPVRESFATDLRLWQRDDGKLLPRVPNSGKDLGVY